MRETSRRQVVAGSLVLGAGAAVAGAWRLREGPSNEQPSGDVFAACGDSSNASARDSASANDSSATIAYATRELASQLEQLGLTLAAEDRGVRVGEVQINLEIDTSVGKDCSIASAPQAHRISRSGTTLTIAAAHGVGVLYGVYTLLESMGFDWPDPVTKHIPERDEALRKLEGIDHQEWLANQAYRGFWIYEPSVQDDDFLRWMARKKFNLGPIWSPELRLMLGIFGWGGGHFLLEEVFSEPGLYESHPEYFARIKFLRRPVAAKDSQFNPAFANEGAARHFADRIADRLEDGDLRNVDVLNVWPVDSFGRSFDESFHAWWVGNASDNLLTFYANVIARLAEHRAAGRLRRTVMIAGASYWHTMAPPKFARNARRLEGKPYLHVFYPIERDWSALAGENARSQVNVRIMGQVAGWKAAGRLQFGVCDYHNMSNYGGLALSDFGHFAANYDGLREGGLDMFAYMHVRQRDSGPRGLTHCLASALAWQSRERASQSGERLVDDYFRRRFGERAQTWREAYGLVFQATENANHIFGMDSLQMLLLQQVSWGEPVYSADQIVDLVKGFFAGGRQLRPGRFYGDEDYATSFLGLVDSIVLIDRSIAMARNELTAAHSGNIRKAMVEDLSWFVSTRNRYRAICALGKSAIATDSAARQAAHAELSAALVSLEQSETIGGTLSPVDQKALFERYRKSAG